jgi:hypothetical protein
MKRIKFTTGDKILMSIYGFLLGTEIVNCFLQNQVSCTIILT